MKSLLKVSDQGHVLLAAQNLEVSIVPIEDQLIEEAEKIKNWGVITPVVVDTYGRVVWNGGFLDKTYCLPQSYNLNELYSNQRPGTRECETAKFLYAIINKEVIEALHAQKGEEEFEIGLLNELPQSAISSMIFCEKVKKLGFKIVQTNIASVTLLKDTISPDEAMRLYEEETKKAEQIKPILQAELNKKLKFPVLYHSNLYGDNGFTTALSGYIKALLEKDIDVRYHPLKNLKVVDVPTDDLQILSMNDKEIDIDMPQIVWGQAPLFFHNSGKYKIGHCEFEGEEFPAEWQEYLNLVDELWVPTKWDREKAIKAGCNKPIYIIPQGINPDIYHPDRTPAELPFREKFRFLCVAAYDPRKNLENLIKSFMAEFKATEDVALVIKTMDVGLGKPAKEELAKINQKYKGGYVHVIADPVEAEDLPGIYTACNAFVLPTHGEGWGLPIFEALACGLPVITTAYGAPNEALRLNDGKKTPFEGVHFLDYKLVPAKTNYVYMENSKWAEPNLIQLMDKMRAMYNNYIEERKQALLGSVRVRDVYSWTKCVEPIITRLQVIYKQGF